MQTHDAPGPQQRELADVLRDLAWTIQRLVPENAGVEPLPLTEVAALKQILATPGITVTELSKVLGMRQSNASAAVRALVERGLAYKQGKPDDRRVTTLMPTERLLAEQELVETAWSGTVRTAMSQLTREELDALGAAVDALRTLDDALRDERTP